MNRRSFLKLLGCIPALPLIGKLAPEEKPEPIKTQFTPDLAKYHQRELLKGAKPYFVSADELNKNWFQKLEKMT